MTTSRERQSPRGRGVLVASFVVYLALLAWVVLFKLEVPWIGEAALLPRPLKLVPFVASGDAGASAPVEVLINLVIFVPFGLFLGALAPAWGWLAATGVLLGSSLLLETVQHLISTGSFDTTDLIVNTAGGLVGFAVFAGVRARLGERAPGVMARVCVIVTVVAVLAVAAFVASPLHYGPQRDVVVSGTSSPG